MAYTDFIAAIDLGSSHMVGMVGTKDTSGALSIVAYEVEKSDTCIRRGCVYNIKDTAYKIVGLIRKLENKLGGARIGKVYIGVGGQSLRTINHTVSKILGTGVVTEETLQEMDRECSEYRPEMLDVLDIASPLYSLDNHSESQPVGMSCSRIEAHYKLIVGRPSLRHAVTTNMVEHIKVDVAGVIVAPLALADLILTDQAKENGCALIDFGAGVTSVTLYKSGKLAGLYVIPLGSHLITRDLMSLDNLPEKEAERIKRTNGNAIWEKEKDPQMIPVDLADGRHGSVKSTDVNHVVEARIREIIENIYARFEDAGVTNEPGYKIVIAGNGSVLKNLREALSNRFNMEVSYAAVRKDLIVEGEMIANNLEYTTAAALLLKGTENCALYVVPEPEVKKPEPAPEPKIVAPEPKEITPDPEPEVKKQEPEIKAPIPPKTPKSTKPKGKGWFGTLWEKAERAADDIGQKIGDTMKEEE